MKAYVVVEGPSDLTLLTRLLPPEVLQHTAVIVGGGRSNVISVARTLLVTKRKPLAVLVDADTMDEAAVLQQRRDTEELLRAVAGGVPFKVFIVTPSVDGLLFRVPAVLERITGQKLSADILSLSRYAPHRAILQMAQNKDVQSKNVLMELIVNGLTTEEANVLREESPLRELIRFLLDHLVLKQQSQSA